MRFMPWMWATAVLALVGCEPASYVLWSPDGTQGAYIASHAKQGMVIDSNGKLLTQVGGSTGGVAWTADSKTLYFVRYDEQADDNSIPLQIDRRWAATTQPIDKEPSSDAGSYRLQRLSNGKIEDLTFLPRYPVLHIALSPDEKWIAIVQWVSKSGSMEDDQPQLFVYSLASRKLYAIANACGVGICFTGPHRLAWVEPDETEGHTQSFGTLVEADLESKIDPALARRPLLNVLWKQTNWMQPTSDGILLSTSPATYPSKAELRSDALSIYRFSRPDGGLAAVAENTAPIFAISPNGKRLLCERMADTVENKPAQVELVVMNINGSDAHVLRTFDKDQEAMYASWHGNDEITFNTPTLQVNTEASSRPARHYYDVALYRIDSQWQLEPLKLLSEKWPIDLKPSAESHAPATQPSTAP